MAFVVPREGMLRLLTDLLGGGSAENWRLGLYHSAWTPSETDTASDYTSREATFTGYSRKTLLRSISNNRWKTPVLQPPSGSPPWSSRPQVAHSQYGQSPVTWTCGLTGDQIFGYFILGASSGKLICAEAFPSPRTLVQGDTLKITPIFENA